MVSHVLCTTCPPTPWNSGAKHLSHRQCPARLDYDQMCNLDVLIEWNPADYLWQQIRKRCSERHSFCAAAISSDCLVYTMWCLLIKIHTHDDVQVHGSGWLMTEVFFCRHLHHVISYQLANSFCVCSMYLTISGHCPAAPCAHSHLAHYIRCNSCKSCYPSWYTYIHWTAPDV